MATPLGLRKGCHDFSPGTTSDSQKSDSSLVLGFGDQDSRVRAKDLGFRVLGLGFRGQGLGLRV
jgi:hypothetical protein